MRALAFASILGCVLGSTALAVRADELSSADRFHLSGYGTVSASFHLLGTDRFRLRATLTDDQEVSSALSTLHEGERFALIAKATSPALVCYNDTIFRDDFD